MEGIIMFEYQVGKPLPGETSSEYEKYVLGLCIEKLIHDPVFSDLTETAIRDVLIKRLSDWNYKKK